LEKGCLKAREYWKHILAVTVLAGVGVGSALAVWYARKKRDRVEEPPLTPEQEAALKDKVDRIKSLAKETKFDDVVAELRKLEPEEFEQVLDAFTSQDLDQIPTLAQAIKKVLEEKGRSYDKYLQRIKNLELIAQIDKNLTTNLKRDAEELAKREDKYQQDWETLKKYISATKKELIEWEESELKDVEDVIEKFKKKIPVEKTKWEQEKEKEREKAKEKFKEEAEKERKREEEAIRKKKEKLEKELEEEEERRKKREEEEKAHMEEEEEKRREEAEASRKKLEEKLKKLEKEAELKRKHQEEELKRLKKEREEKEEAEREKQKERARKLEEETEEKRRKELEKEKERMKRLEEERKKEEETRLKKQKEREKKLEEEEEHRRKQEIIKQIRLKSKDEEFLKKAKKVYTARTAYYQRDWKRLKEFIKADENELATWDLDKLQDVERSVGSFERAIL
jgi:hypothetical protein